MNAYYPNLNDIWRVVRETDYFLSSEPEKRERIETALRICIAVHGPSATPRNRAVIVALQQAINGIALPEGCYGPARFIRLETPEQKRDLFTTFREIFTTLQAIPHPNDPTRWMIPPGANPVYHSRGIDDPGPPEPDADTTGTPGDGFPDVPPERLAYKFIAPVPDQAKVSRGFIYPKPGADGPSEWFEADAGALKNGRRGIHTLHADSVLKFMVTWHSNCHCELWAMEGDGDFVKRDHVIVWRRARILRKVWTAATCRLLAADLAMLALPAFERFAPDDIRPFAAIDAARQYAVGFITDDELRSAGHGAYLASFAPSGHSEARRDNDPRAARAAAIVAERAAGIPAPGETTTAIINAVVAAALDAGVPWEPMVARSLDYIRDGEGASRSFTDIAREELVC